MTMGKRIAQALYEGGWLSIHRSEIPDVARVIDRVLEAHNDR